MAQRERGFAAMDEAKQREIARKGGRAAHESGNAHQFTPEEARKAGRKGGRKVSQDRAYMAEIGRRGGKVAHQRGTAHEWTGQEAAAAGRQGGRSARRNGEAEAGG
jgi:general stress protein YciG